MITALSAHISKMMKTKGRWKKLHLKKLRAEIIRVLDYCFRSLLFLYPHVSKPLPIFSSQNLVRGKKKEKKKQPTLHLQRN